MPQAPPDESEKPPMVFLSYQWDHQLEVKAIKKHLEMAGFPCWMDIGQMGGGDQLFAKISQGMRSSKVVLCMVTEKYSNSENCNKEVRQRTLKSLSCVIVHQILHCFSFSVQYLQLNSIEHWNLLKSYIYIYQWWGLVCLQDMYCSNWAL